MLGYAVGGSFSEAFVGSTLHHDSRSDDRTNSGFNSSCEASSDADLGVSSSEIIKDCGIPSGTVHRQRIGRGIHERTVDPKPRINPEKQPISPNDKKS